MLDTLSHETRANLYAAHVQNVWNELIPASAIKTEITGYGVRYLHPTKGYRTVGKRRFAIRGVI